MWILLPLALVLAGFALWAGLTSGPAPRLPRAEVVPVLRTLAGITLAGLAFGLLIGYASAKRTQERVAYATLRDARQRLAEKPRDPEIWKAKIASAEAELSALERTPPSLSLVLDPLSRAASLTLVLSAFGSGLVLFRKRLGPMK